jgi:HSP20 family protein
MPNIIRRPSEQAPQVMNDPFRLMRDLMRFDPFREMGVEIPSALFGGELAYAPAFEVRETTDAFVFKADLPGVKDKDIDVKLTGNRLQISGKRDQERQEQQDTYYTYERSYGSFLRTFTLPDGADLDHVQADLKEGVLTVAVPKKAPTQARAVAIKGADTPRS